MGECTFISMFAVNFKVSPTIIPINTMESDSPGGVSFCLGDGSVRFISETIDYRLYNEIGTIAGGEVVSVP